MIFNPKESQRGSYSYFAEYHAFRGPQSIGSVGNGSFSDLFQKDWALVFTRDNLLKLFHWNDLSDDWDEIAIPNPLPVFDNTERRFSAAFDQAARLVITYEKAGTIFVNYYNAVGQSYQTRTFAGINPTLLQDALVNKQIGESDILCGYQKPNEHKLFLRFQRETYGTERELGVTLAGILDKLAPLYLRWQALMTDSKGIPLTGLPSSDLYPYSASVGLAGSGTWLGAELDESLFVHTPSLLLSGFASWFAQVQDTVTLYNEALSLTGSASWQPGVLQDTTTLYNEALKLAGFVAWVSQALVTHATVQSDVLALAGSGMWLAGAMTTAQVSGDNVGLAGSGSWVNNSLFT